MSAFGVAGSRHINSRRRGSSPSVSPQPKKLLSHHRLSKQLESIDAGNDDDDVDDDNKSAQRENDSQNSENNQSDSGSGNAASPSIKQNRSNSNEISASSLRSRRQSQNTSVPNVSRAQARLSVPDLPGGTRFRQRRRAVEISDHKTCVLLHSKLKGMKLEDIA